jgi:hypothetical protein
MVPLAARDGLLIHRRNCVSRGSNLRTSRNVFIWHCKIKSRSFFIRKKNKSFLWKVYIANLVWFVTVATTKLVDVAMNMKLFERNFEFQPHLSVVWVVLALLLWTSYSCQVVMGLLMSICLRRNSFSFICFLAIMYIFQYNHVFIFHRHMINEINIVCSIYIPVTPTNSDQLRTLSKLLPSSVTRWSVCEHKPNSYFILI